MPEDKKKPQPVIEDLQALAAAKKADMVVK